MGFLRRRRRRNALRLAVVVPLKDHKECVGPRQRASRIAAEVARLRHRLQDLHTQVEAVDRELARQQADEHVEALEQHRTVLRREVATLKERIDVRLDERAALLKQEASLLQVERTGVAPCPTTRRARRRGRWRTT